MMHKHLRHQILIVDDDEVARTLLKEIIERESYPVQLASSGEEAIELSKTQFYSIIISDIKMLDIDGLDVLHHFRTHDPRSVVILLTAFGSMETAIKAIKGGAFDYISKPFKLNEFKIIFEKAVKHAEILQSPQGTQLNSQLRGMNAMIGSSSKMLHIFKTLAKAAMSEASVLILGESGTGKELIARAIHENSSRRNKKWVAINCGALTDPLLESELFGHVKGSFTGAHENRKGLFEEAHSGTLFLDEIGDISAQMQVKLLRVLQEGEIRPVGSNEIKKVDVRIIAATQHELYKKVQQGHFREDLYYRLKVIDIELPPLRERKEDLVELIQFFIVKYSNKNKKQISHMSKEALDLLCNYSWPGNIRELENTIEHAIALTSTSRIDVDDLPNFLNRTNNSTPNSVQTLEELEKKHILETLQKVNFHKTKAAEILGIDRATLYRKAQKYGIEF